MMKSFNFLKMDALGNDYVYVVTEQNLDLDVNELIKHIPKISDRHSGIGSDGLICWQGEGQYLVQDL